MTEAAPREGVLTHAFAGSLVLALVQKLDGARMAEPIFADVVVEVDERGEHLGRDRHVDARHGAIGIADELLREHLRTLSRSETLPHFHGAFSLAVAPGDRLARSDLVDLRGVPDAFVLLHARDGDGDSGGDQCGDRHAPDELALCGCHVSLPFLGR
ncbi:hypothetical protein CPZ06_09940 [Lactobacillus acidophilus]|nr:hypothetical protein CPZ06_09940 [Lactobacillus acidophilus]